uniref:Uncharacterized protein n=1 Tax=Oryza glumipatula TaxID=40148 RepID=A0A0D9Y7M5_9ORYZ
MWFGAETTTGSATLHGDENEVRHCYPPFSSPNHHHLVELARSALGAATHLVVVASLGPKQVTQPNQPKRPHMTNYSRTPPSSPPTPSRKSFAPGPSRVVQIATRPSLSPAALSLSALLPPPVTASVAPTADSTPLPPPVAASLSLSLPPHGKWRTGWSRVTVTDGARRRVARRTTVAASSSAAQWRWCLPLPRHRAVAAKWRQATTTREEWRWGGQIQPRLAGSGLGQQRWRLVGEDSAWSPSSRSPLFLQPSPTELIVIVADEPPLHRLSPRSGTPPTPSAASTAGPSATALSRGQRQGEGWKRNSGRGSDGQGTLTLANASPGSVSQQKGGEERSPAKNHAPS